MVQSGQSTSGLGSAHSSRGHSKGDAIRGRSQPIIGYAGDYPAGHSTGCHIHSRHQLVHSQSGVLSLWTSIGAWVVPPGYAVWVPSGMRHEIRAVGPSALRTLYVHVDAGIPIDEPRRVLVVSPLVRELIARAITFTQEFADGGPESRIVSVLADELLVLQPTSLNLPLPYDSRARKVAEQLMMDASDPRDLAAWGQWVGASGRTLARRFKAETGLSFGQWRQKRRLLAALEALATGSSVTRVALDLGYETPSAFITMFRKALGQSPTRYRKGHLSGA